MHKLSVVAEFSKSKIEQVTATQQFPSVVSALHPVESVQTVFPAKGEAVT
jgi:hypothetical protein